jgi:Uma2 family endonuclease
MPAAVAKLTWDDIKDRPENRLELVDGELIVSPIADWKHQRICRTLGAVILPYVEARNLGEFYPLPIHVVLEPGTEYEPDCCFIAAPAALDESEACYRGVPELIIEVISESNRTHDTNVKFRDYERFGVKEYWLADPREAHVRVFYLNAAGKYELLGVFGRGQRIVSRVFPELVLDPSRLFEKR